MKVKKTKKITPKYAHYTEVNALRAGESAFKARVPFTSNPYLENPFKSSWIRGFKRAEKAFYEAIKLSQKVQDSIGYEEVEA